MLLDFICVSSTFMVVYFFCSFWHVKYVTCVNISFIIVIIFYSVPGVLRQKINRGSEDGRRYLTWITSLSYLRYAYSD